MKRSAFVIVTTLMSSTVFADQLLIQPGPADGSDTCYGTVYAPSGCGAVPSLYFGGWGDKYIDFLRFDVWNGPDADKVSRVMLVLTAQVPAPNDPRIQVRMNATPWSETALSRTNYPDAVSTFVRMTRSADALTYSANITSFYKRWKDNLLPNYGVSLTPTFTDQSNGSFYSSEEADPTLRPKLVIDFVP